MRSGKHPILVTKGAEEGVRRVYEEAQERMQWLEELVGKAEKIIEQNKAQISRRPHDPKMLGTAELNAELMEYNPMSPPSIQNYERDRLIMGYSHSGVKESQKTLDELNKAIIVRDHDWQESSLKQTNTNIFDGLASDSIFGQNIPMINKEGSGISPNVKPQPRKNLKKFLSDI